MRGRVVLDVYLWMLNNFRLDEYKLDSVCKAFLGGMTKEDLHFTEITPKWQAGPHGRRELGIYCLKDAELPLALIQALSLLFNAVERARVTGLPLEWVLNRGIYQSAYEGEHGQGLSIAACGSELPPQATYNQVCRGHCAACTARHLASGGCLGFFLHVPQPNHCRESVLQHLLSRQALGSRNALIPHRAIAETTTGLGRKDIGRVKAIAESLFTIEKGYPGDAKVVCGDTDSVFVSMPTRAIEGLEAVQEAIQMAHVLADAVNQEMRKPKKIEFEKVYDKILLMMKKRYVSLPLLQQGSSS